MITSPFNVGAIDIRWDNPQLIPQNGGLNLLGVNIYRSTDSPYGPYEKVNDTPVTVMFYRDQTIETLVIDEDATPTIKHALEPTNNWLDQWLVYSQNKPIVIPGSNGAYTTRISDVQVKIDNGDGNFLIMPAFAVNGVTGQIQLISAPVYNNDLNQIIPPRLPTPPRGRVRISYSYIKHQVLTVLNQRLFYKVTTVATDPKNPGGTIETPLEEISDRSPFDMEAIDYIWREAILRNRFILEQGGERVMLFSRKWMGEQCPDHQVNYGQGYNDCHTCFPAGQEVTLFDGSRKNIENVVVGDNVIDHKGSIEKVLELKKRDYSGLLYKLNVIGKDSITCTEEHPFLVIKSEDARCDRLNHLPKGCKCVPMTKGLCFKGYNKRKTDCTYRPETSWVIAKELKKGDYLLLPRIKTEKNEFSKEEMFLFGFYVAEGCVSKNSVGTKNRLRFVFGKKEINIVNIVRDMFKVQYGKELRLFNSSNVYELAIHDKEIADRFIKHCGEYAHTKKISSDILQSSKDLTNFFLGGYVLGDGHVSKSKRSYGLICYSTVSKNLSSQLELLFSKIGCTVRSHLKYRKDNRPNRETSSGWAYLSIVSAVSAHLVKLFGRKEFYREIKKKSHRILPLQDFICFPISEISTEKFEGPVYNLEVGNSHSYLINNLIVHNCLGTSIKGGYLGPIQLMIAPPETEKSVELADMGLHIRYDWQSWASNWPLLNERDVIVRQNNERYVVGPVNPQGARGAIFQQHFTMSYIDQGDIRYQIDIPGAENGPPPSWDRYRTEKPPTPASPEMPLKPTVDPAKIIRGRTVTFENISY
jgi:hypothetical protein